MKDEVVCSSNHREFQRTTQILQFFLIRPTNFIIWPICWRFPKTPTNAFVRCLRIRNSVFDSKAPYKLDARRNIFPPLLQTDAHWKEDSSARVHVEWIWILFRLQHLSWSDRPKDRTGTYGSGRKSYLPRCWSYPFNAFCDCVLQIVFESYGQKQGPHHGLPISTPYVTKDHLQVALISFKCPLVISNDEVRSSPYSSIQTGYLWSPSNDQCSVLFLWFLSVTKRPNPYKVDDIFYS